MKRLPAVSFLLLLLLVGACSSPEPERERRIPSPSDLRDRTEPNRARSDNPAQWNIRVRMESAELDEQSVRRAGINWNVQTGNVQAGGGAPLPQNGLRVGVTTPDVNATAVLQRSGSTVRRSTSQFVTTLNNRPATLSLRRIEPGQLSGQIVVYGPQGNTVINRYGTRITGVELRVRPEVIDRGPYLRLHLTPVLVRGGQQAVEIRELRTTVRVRSGQSVLLASSDQRRQSIGSTLFSTGASRRSGSFAWIVTPEIMN